MVYLLISVFVLNLTAFLIPKRMSISEILITCLFAEILQNSTDVIFDLKYNLYGYFKPGVDYMTLIAIGGLYPAFSTIYLNFFPYGKTRTRKACYIMAFTAFSIFYEWTSLKDGFFYYNGWRLYYSLPIYPFLLVLLALHFHFVKRFSRK